MALLQTLKNFWKWFKVIAPIIFGAILLIYLATKLGRIIEKAKLRKKGTVSDSIPFYPVPGNPSSVIAKTPDGFKEVELPKGQTYDTISTIGYSPKVDGILAEPKHAPTITTGGTPISDSAASRLGH